MRRIACCAGLLLGLCGCVGEGDFRTPPLDCTPGVQVNETFEEWLESEGGGKRSTDGKGVFVAYVVSSDAAGNFYKAICLEAAPEDSKCAGVEIRVDLTDAYLDYPPGAKLLVQPSGLSLKRKDGVLQLGYPCREAHCPSGVGRIDANALSQHLHLSCDAIAGIPPRVYERIREAKSDENLNTLVQLKGVVFAARDTAKCYADERGDGNRLLMDRAGDQLIVRSSRYAAFAGLKLPAGSGCITGVLGKYKGDFELRIRDRSDVHLDKPRFKALQSEKSRPDFPCPREYEAGFTNLCYLHRLYKGQARTLKAQKIRVVVTSDNKGGNIHVMDAAVQDRTAGILLHFDRPPIIFSQHRNRPLRPGDSLEVELAGAVLTDSMGQLQVNASRDKVHYLDTKQVKPIVITIEQLNTNRYESMLVELDEVSYAQPGFPFYSGEGEALDHELWDATGKTCVHVSRRIQFASSIVPEGVVSVVGNAGNHRGIAQLMPRNGADVQPKTQRQR